MKSIVRGQGELLTVGDECPRSAHLWVIEGPDGAGKTTLAQLIAARTGARYVHCPPFTKMFSGVNRLYFEIMIPALLGYQNVVMDRSWLSEPIYAEVMREGHSRVGAVMQRMLERVALRAGAVVVRCLPDWERVKHTWRRRASTEYLSDESKLRAVYDAYATLGQQTCLPVVPYDFESGGPITEQVDVVLRQTQHARRSWGAEPHPLAFESAGRWEAPFVLLGERFAEHKDKDSWYQYPFVSWAKEGCSQWATLQLHQQHVPETDLLWLNVDDDEGETDLVQFLGEAPHTRTVIALGERAADVAHHQGVECIKVPHPQYWKRFRVKEPYHALFHALKGVRVVC